jgi:hypothetical protein
MVRQWIAVGMWVGISAMACAGLAAGEEQGNAQASGQGSGQANVQGRVVQETSGEGIRKVVVELRASGGEGSEAKEYSTATDGAGQFVFEGMAAGQYTISFARAGYVAAKMKAQDSIITVAAGQDVTGLVYKMQAAGVIAGKIVDADGDPVANANVWVTRAGKTGGGASEGEPGRASTNDLGEFRIANLRAGQYVVRAQAVGAGPGPNPADKGKQKERAVYAITFYPGTLDEKQAGPVQVTPGGIATANFGMLVSGAFRVSGVVPGLGKATMTQLMLSSKSGQGDQQRLGEDGKFEFPNVPPGTYTAQVLQMSIGGDGLTPSMKMYAIHEPIVVSTADVTGLVLQPDAGGTVRGTFRAEGEEKVGWRELSAYLLSVGEEAEQSEAAMVFQMGGVVSGIGNVKEDGSFEIKNVPGGNYQLVVGSPTEKFRDYYTKSVMLGGRDVADTGFAMSGDAELEVVISARGASIEGTVVDSKGEAVAQATVVTLPSSGKLGRPDAYQTARTDERGHFLVRGMNPGEFTVVAVENMEGNFRRPEFFQKYGESGAKVELGEGERKNVTVKVSGEG